MEGENLESAEAEDAGGISSSSVSSLEKLYGSRYISLSTVSDSNNENVEAACPSIPNTTHESETEDIPQLPPRPRNFVPIKKKRVHGDSVDIWSDSCTDNMVHNKSNDLLVDSHATNQGSTSSLQDWRNINFSRSSSQLDLYGGEYMFTNSDDYFCSQKNGFPGKELEDDSNALMGVSRRDLNSPSLNLSENNIYYQNKEASYSLDTVGSRSNPSFVSYSTPDEQNRKNDDLAAKATSGSASENVLSPNTEEDLLKSDVKPTFARYTIKRNEIIPSPAENGIPTQENYFYSQKNNLSSRDLEEDGIVIVSSSGNPSSNNPSSKPPDDSVYYRNKEASYSSDTGKLCDAASAADYDQKNYQVKEGNNILTKTGSGHSLENALSPNAGEGLAKTDIKPTFDRYTMKRNRFIPGPAQDNGGPVSPNNPPACPDSQAPATTPEYDLLYGDTQNNNLYDFAPNIGGAEEWCFQDKNIRKQLEITPTSQQSQRKPLSALEVNVQRPPTSASSAAIPITGPGSAPQPGLGSEPYRAVQTGGLIPQTYGNDTTSTDIFPRRNVIKAAGAQDVRRKPLNTPPYSRGHNASSDPELHRDKTVELSLSVGDIPERGASVGGSPIDPDVTNRSNMQDYKDDRVSAGVVHQQLPLLAQRNSNPVKPLDPQADIAYDPANSLGKSEPISGETSATPKITEFKDDFLRRESGVVKISFEDTIRMYRMNAKKSQDPVVKFAFAKYCLEQSRKAKTKAAAEELVEEGYKLLKKLALSGHADSMYTLGEAYIDDRRYDLGYAQLIQAAKRSHVGACFAVARCAEKGYGTKKSNTSALGFYTKAAQAGWKPALYRLGLAELNGELGLKPNPKKAVMWLRRAAAVTDKDNLEPLLLLALIFEKGVQPQILPDVKYARGMLIEAAKLGSPPAQYVLGNSYERGRFGCQIDMRVSIFWYNSAARLRDTEAQFALASLYLKGYPGILEINENYSYFWAYEAAVNGHVKSQYAVGNFSENGIGCQKDFSRAMRWYAIAAKNGNENAKKRLLAEKNAHMKLAQKVPETTNSRARAGKNAQTVKSGGVFRGKWR